MTRKECLDKAAECVLKDRQNEYGKPEDCFERIAALWSAYLNRAVYAHDVGAMMVLLKVARFKANPMHLDSAVDCAGYAACMAEIATAWGEEQAEAKADRRFLDGVFGRHDIRPAPKAEGCEDLVQKDAPQTKEELMQRIVDCSPSTFGCVHKPTGEELAEMAEEDAHE